MDAFAITGVSPEHEWFRVQAAVGGIESPARLFPRIHVVRSANIADLASGGRRIYFQQDGSEDPLVPLAFDDAATFEAVHVPIEDMRPFAFLETATDDDIQALLHVKNGDDPNANTLDRLERLEALGWVLQDASGTLDLTPIGQELLRYRLA